MKVIDLLNKMRLFNDYRPNIVFKGKRYLYDKCLGNYSCGDFYGLFRGYCIELILDDEIEIIEEPKEELEEIELIDIHYVNDKCIFKVNGQSIEETIAIKVNELIDEVNKLKKESDM